MTILPVIAVVGISFWLGKKSSKNRLNQKKAKALKPLDSAFGTIFDGLGEGAPNVVKSSIGERVSIKVPLDPDEHYRWELVGLPPNDVLKNTGRCSMDGIFEYFIFDAKTQGGGSIVMHLDPIYQEDLPPKSIVDIKVKINGE